MAWLPWLPVREGVLVIGMVVVIPLFGLALRRRYLVWRIPEPTLLYQTSRLFWVRPRVLPLGLLDVRIRGEDISESNVESRTLHDFWVEIRLAVFPRRWLEFTRTRSLVEANEIVAELETLVG